MEKYTIYCSTEQVKKALELGAPIIDNGKSKNVPVMLYNRKGYEIPTAEQMICWLEENKIIASIIPHYYGVNNINTHYRFMIKIQSKVIESIEFYPSRQEATIAVIDAALDYLIKIKEE